MFIIMVGGNGSPSYATADGDGVAFTSSPASAAWFADAADAEAFCAARGVAGRLVETRALNAGHATPEPMPVVEEQIEQTADVAEEPIA